MIWRIIYNAYCNNCRRNNRDLAAVSPVMVRFFYKVQSSQAQRHLKAQEATNGSFCLVLRVTGDNIEEAEKLVWEGKQFAQTMSCFVLTLTGMGAGRGFFQEKVLKLKMLA